MMGFIQKIEMKVCFLMACLFFIFWGTTHLQAEGTKQLMPASSSYGYVQFNDVGRPFALTTNTDSLYRLYFRISNTTEKVYFGFKRLSSSTATSGTFRIKNPAGSIVYTQTTIPSTGTGYISTYAQAVAGPKIGGTPAAGYTPFTFTPAVTGDFYIEFASNSNGNFRFELFDITVTNASNTPIDGRLWAYAWDLSTAGGTNPFNGSFYVYTQEGYVSKVGMNGIQPFGFVVCCNNSGPRNTGDLVVDRQSISGNSTRPQFKVFLNDPDKSIYPSAVAPSLTSPIAIASNSISYGQAVVFSAGVSAAGTIQIILSMNGVSGYQAGSTDVIIAANVVAGNNTFNWNGLNGVGNYPVVGTQIEISTGFSSGITHLPIYDPETNSSGFIVDRIRPGSGSAPIRWDDNVLGGTVNVSGGSSNGHTWATNFGDAKTINTWWNGYEVENMDQFSMQVSEVTPLSVSLIDFSGFINSTGNPFLVWTTATEKDNAFFIIERMDHTEQGFKYLGKIDAHHAQGLNKYAFEDLNALKGDAYYRLIAVDFSGRHEKVGKVLHLKIERTAKDFEIYPSICTDGILKLRFFRQEMNSVHISIRNTMGHEVFSVDVFPEVGNEEATLYLPPLPEGIYFAVSDQPENVQVRKFIIK